MMDFCGELHCDFIEELQKRDMMDHIMEKILFHLDIASIRNVRLVSKAWKGAVLVFNNKIWKNLIKHGNGHRDLRLFLSKHLELDFLVPVEDEFYNQRFCNTIFFSSEEIIRASLELDFTIEFLPYSFPKYYLFGRSHMEALQLCDNFEMNDLYIVALDSNNWKMKYWSRRLLTSPPRGIDKIVLAKEIYQTFTGRNFGFFEDHLIVGAMEPWQSSQPHPTILKINLKANNDFPTSLTEEKRPITLYVPHSLGLMDYAVRYLKVEGRFLLVVFEHLDALPHNYRLVVWTVEELDSPPWKLLEVPKTLKDYFFMDDEYLVVLNQDIRLHTTFLVFSMLERETGPARVIASINVDSTIGRHLTGLSVQYKNGFLVIGSTTGDVRFIEVQFGRTVRTIQTEINFSAPGSLIRLSNSSELFYICYAASPPMRGTVFQKRNFNDDLKSGSSLEPLASFDAFTGEVVDFKFDALGIVALMREEGQHGIQVLSFLPQCSGCKKISKMIPLKCCSRCKRAKYCSPECQQTDWNHHEVICSKLAFIK